MEHLRSLLHILCSVIVCTNMILAISPSSYINSQDRERLRLVLEPAWSLSELPQVLYASAGYKHLGLQVPDKENVCKLAKDSVKDGSGIETLFFASSAGKVLDCPLAASAGSKQVLMDALKEGTSSQDLYHAVTAAKNLNIDFESAPVLKAVQHALKKDDSVLSLGYIFHVGSQLKGDVSSVYEHVEDAIVQADEIDGQMLQFEGGLSVTALVLSGAYKLSEAVNKSIPIREEQAVKFANYLMSRKSVQLPKGVYSLLEAVSVLTSNKFHIPAAITLASNVAVSSAAPNIQIRITGLMGTSFGSLKLVAESVVSDTDGSVLLSDHPFQPVPSDKTVYELNIMDAKPARGFYKIIVSARGGDKRLVGHVKASLSFKVLTEISLQDVEFGTGDSDHSTAPNLKKFSYPSHIGEIGADQHQKIILRFSVVDLSTKKPTRVHQAFVKFSSVDTNQEIIFVAEPDSSNNYKFDMDVSTRRKEFGGINGKYAVDLIVGDASISNPILWHFAEVSLTFPDGVISGSDVSDYTYKARPEIHHLFRSPDPRPPKLMSDAFTVLCLVPIVILFVLWGRLGINVSSFPLSVSAIVFHLGLTSIFGLFGLFWMKLDMFTTLRYMLMLGIVTFFSGNSMLSYVAASRKEQEVKMVYGSSYHKSYRFPQK